MLSQNDNTPDVFRLRGESGNLRSSSMVTTIRNYKECMTSRRSKAWQASLTDQELSNALSLSIIADANALIPHAYNISCSSRHESARRLS